MFRLRLNCWWRLSYGALRTNLVWCIWIMLFLARHSRNGLNTSWQCFRGSAELTSHLTQRSVSYSRRNCSYNGESAKQCDHWPTPENTYIKELPCVVYILNEVRSWKRWKLTAVNTTDEREEDIHWSPETEDAFTYPPVVTMYCTDFMLLKAGRKVYCGHRHGQRRYWRSLALKVSSGWCLTDHQGQKHTNLGVILPNPSSAPAHVQATTAYGRMNLHVHHLNLRTVELRWLGVRQITGLQWSTAPPAASNQRAQYPRMGGWVGPTAGLNTFYPCQVSKYSFSVVRHVPRLS